jgi:hypothetical protein
MFAENSAVADGEKDVSLIPDSVVQSVYLNREAEGKAEVHAWTNDVSSGLSGCPGRDIVGHASSA